MICDICGALNSVKTVSEPITVNWCGKVVAVEHHSCLHCDKCDERYYTPEQAHILSEAVKKAVNDLEKLGQS